VSAQVASGEAVRVRDEAAFARLVERHRRELQAHCYRMTGSREESEDAVQETFLRAWRSRHRFEGRGSSRGWLYRIATNASLDAIAARRRRGAEHVPEAQSRAEERRLPAQLEEWLEPAAPRDEEPDARLISRETVELTLLVAVQELAPRQRAVLIMRDVLGRSARDTGERLGMSIAAVNSALQRARTAMRAALTGGRTEWAPASEPSRREREALAAWMSAIESDQAILPEWRRTTPRSPVGRSSTSTGASATPCKS
jgi:RNA polymerase sigma-70 factor (ECF subfamily)